MARKALSTPKAEAVSAQPAQSSAIPGEAGAAPHNPTPKRGRSVAAALLDLPMPDAEAAGLEALRAAIRAAGASLPADLLQQELESALAASKAAQPRRAGGRPIANPTVQAMAEHALWSLQGEPWWTSDRRASQELARRLWPGLPATAAEVPADAPAWMKAQTKAGISERALALAFERRITERREEAKRNAALVLLAFREFGSHPLWPKINDAMRAEAQREALLGFGPE